jgi:cell division protein FtsB
LYYVYMGMKEEKRRRELRSKILRRILILFLLCILWVCIRGTWSVYQKNNIAVASKKRQEEAHAALVLRKSELSDEVGRLESERGIEEEIRTSFPVSLPGEGVVVVTSEKIDEQKVENNDITEDGFLEKIKNWFR